MVEEPEVCAHNLKERNCGKKAKQNTRKHHQTKLDAAQTDTDECHRWTAVKCGDPPLKAETDEFGSRREIFRTRPEVVSLPEEHREEEHNVEEEIDAPAVEPESKQSNTDAWGDRPKRIRQRRHVYMYEKLGQPTFQQLKTCTVSSPSGPSHDSSATLSFMYPFHDE